MDTALPYRTLRDQGLEEKFRSWFLLRLVSPPKTQQEIKPHWPWHGHCVFMSRKGTQPAHSRPEVTYGKRHRAILSYSLGYLDDDHAFHSCQERAGSAKELAWPGSKRGIVSSEFTRWVKPQVVTRCVAGKVRIESNLTFHVGARFVPPYAGGRMLHRAADSSAAESHPCSYSGKGIDAGTPTG